MKVAIYCRLSEEDRNKQFETDDSNSIQNQKIFLENYARGQRLTNISKIVSSKVQNGKKFRKNLEYGSARWSA